jgi:hypothetical protein
MKLCSASIAHQNGDAAKAVSILKQLQSTQADAGVEDVTAFMLQGDIAYEVSRELHRGLTDNTGCHTWQPEK